jgi:hypothetical protein
LEPATNSFLIRPQTKPKPKITNHQVPQRRQRLKARVGEEIPKEKEEEEEEEEEEAPRGK